MTIEEVIGERWMPPSGRWVGVYTQYEKEYNFTMILTFLESSQNFYGYCQDEENDQDLDFADILGKWFRRDGSVFIEFNKHYRDKHDVNYSGEFCENFTKIFGSYFDGDGEFVLHHKPDIVTQEPKNAEIENTMFAQIRQYFLSNRDHLSDFDIICKSSAVIKSHKIILATQSKYFEGLFRTESAEKVSLEFDASVIKLCVEFMYTARCEVDDGNVQDILEAANYLGITCLVELAAAYIAKNIDISNCVEIAKLSSCIDSKILSSSILTFLVDNFQFLVDDIDDKVYDLPAKVFRNILDSDNVTMKTRIGNITPGFYREYHLLEQAYKYSKKSPDVDISVLLEPIRIPHINNIGDLAHFMNYKELENKDEIAKLCKLYSSDYSEMKKSRLLAREEILNHEPRFSKVTVDSNSYKPDVSSQNRKFDLSCENFNQNIRKITLFSLAGNMDGSDEILKKIQIIFCDGSEKTVATESGSYNREYNIDLGEDRRHVLYLTGPWVADPLEHLLGLRFILSDGSQLSFRGNQDDNENEDGRKQSVLDFLPGKFHAGNVRWIGLTGSILDTSQCGDSVICNLKFRFSGRTPYSKCA